MRIGNPQNEKGVPLMAGISVVSDGIAICSDVTAVANGSNVTVASASSGVVSISVDLSPLSSVITSKLDKPYTDGTANQILATNGDGTTVWIDKGGDMVAWSSVTGKPPLLDSLPSSVGSSGTYLRAGSNGVTSWTAFDVTVNQYSYNAPTGSAVHVRITSHENDLNAHLPSGGTSSHILMMGRGNAVWVPYPTSVASAGFASTATSAVSAGSVASAAVAGSASSVPFSGVSGMPDVVVVSSVSVLPVDGIDSNAMYVVPNGNTTGDDRCDEYIRHDGRWELVGRDGVPTSTFESHTSNQSVHVPVLGMSNGYYLKVVNNTPAWAEMPTASSIESGTSLPSYGEGDGGRVLAVNPLGNGIQWQRLPDIDAAVTSNGSNAVAGSAIWRHVSSAIAAIPSGSGSGGGNIGDMTIASYVNGNGVVKSASYATSALTAGLASSAARLANDRLIGSAVFNGTADVTLAAMGVASAVHSHLNDAWFTSALSSKLTTPTTGRSYGKVLAVDSTGTGYEWVTVQAGGGSTDSAMWATVTSMGSSLDSHIADGSVHVPAFTSANNGQVLKVDAGALTWGADATGGGGGATLPSYGSGDANKVLKVNGGGDGIYWGSAEAGAPASHTHSTTDITGFDSAVSAVAASIVSNPVISLTQGGVLKGTFSLNQSIGSTIALDAGGGAGTVDASLDSASHNPVENRAIWSALSGIGELLDRI